MADALKQPGPADYRGHLYHLRTGRIPLGEWMIEDILGGGGFGAVAKVRGPSGELGALKLTKPKECRNEAEILRNFGGGSIPVLLSDAVELSDVDFPAAYYVRELADQTLGEFLAGPEIIRCTAADNQHYREIDRRLAYDDRDLYAWSIAKVVLSALTRVSPLVHGDLCPNNILIFDCGPELPKAKVADWGSAREHFDGDTSHTLMPAKDLWRPPWAQALAYGRPGVDVEFANHRTDIYAVGALVCWILTGTVPDQLVRWDCRLDPDSGEGLPLDRVEEHWHPFLIGTTRAERYDRLDREAATAALRELDDGDIAPERPRPIRITQPQPRSKARARTKAIAAALGLAICVTGTVVAVETLKSQRNAATAPPASPSTAPPERCIADDVVCGPDLLHKLADATAATSSQVVQTGVRGWYRGRLDRQEYRPDTSAWVPTTYQDVAVLRLNFRNSSTWQRTVSAGQLGLIVELPAGASIPTGLVTLSNPDLTSGDSQLAWAPPLPPADNRPANGQLLPDSVVPPGTATGDDFPYTALFNLSAASSAHLVGLANGTVLRRDGALVSATVSGFLPAQRWPTEATMDGLYDDLSTTTASTGACLIKLYDVGLFLDALSCARPHDSEVVGLAAAQGDQEGMIVDFSIAFAACQSSFDKFGQLDPALKPVTRAAQGSKVLDNGQTEVLCLVETDAGLWVGAKSQPAIDGAH